MGNNFWFSKARVSSRFHQDRRLNTLDRVHQRSVSQSRKERIFPSSSMGSRKLTIDVLLLRRTTRSYWVPRLLSINASLASRAIRFALSLFPVNPSREGGEKKRHPGQREKSLS